MSFRITAVATILFVFLAPPVGAADKNDLFRGFTTEEFSEAMLLFGRPMEQKGHALYGTTFKAPGKLVKRYSVGLYNCAERDGAKRCGTVRFYTHFGKSDAPDIDIIVSNFNNNALLGNAWVDDKKYVNLKLSLIADDGITRQNFFNWVQAWETLVTSFGKVVPRN